MMKPTTAVAALLFSLAASSAFASADVAVSASRDFNNQYTFAVENRGPEDVAEAVALLIEAPAALLIRNTAEQQCDVSVRPVRCFIPLLAKGPGVQFHFWIDGPSPEVDATYE